MPKFNCMKKILFVVPLLFLLTRVSAQVEVLKLTGQEGKDYRLGFGAFLKFAFPVNEASFLTIEAGANFIGQKEDREQGMAIIPAKLGYRYTINGSGIGFYVEPQVGYNIYGVKSVYKPSLYNYEDQKFHGIIGSFGAGYLFKPGNKIQFDLGAYYESVFYNGSSTRYFGLRLTHNFGFGKKEDY